MHRYPIWMGALGAWLVLSANAGEVPPSGAVSPVRLTTNKHIAGGATRVCLDPKYYENDLDRTVPEKYNPIHLRAASPDRDWWITPAHVVNDRPVEVRIGKAEKDPKLERWIEPKLEMVDASIDLVLFSTPKLEKDPVCFPLAREIRGVPYAYRYAPYSSLFPFYTLRVEAVYAKNSWSTMAPDLLPGACEQRTTLMASKAFPGRDAVQTLLLAPIGMGSAGANDCDIRQFVPRPGISGGVLTAPFDQGVVSENPQKERRVLGLAAALTGGVGTLPAPVIFKRLVENFRIGIPQLTFDRLSVLGGVRYSIPVIYYRMAGTGGLGDGGNEIQAPSQERRSGIEVDGKLWKSIVAADVTWQEGENIPGPIYGLLKTPEKLQGVFEKIDARGLWASDAMVALPSWIPSRDVLKPLSEVALDSDLRCRLDFASIYDMKESRVTTRTLESPLEKNVAVCENTDSKKSRVTYLSIAYKNADPSLSPKYLVWKMELTRELPCSTDGCRLELSSQAFEVELDRTESRDGGVLGAVRCLNHTPVDRKDCRVVREMGKLEVKDSLWSFSYSSSIRGKSSWLLNRSRGYEVGFYANPDEAVGMGGPHPASSGQLRFSEELKAF